MRASDFSTRAALALLVAFALLHVTAANAQAQTTKKNDLLEILMSTGEKSGKKTKEYDDSGYRGPQPVPLPSPPRAMFDECVLKNMQGASSDVAARSIRAACEAKQADAIEKERQAFDRQYGPSIKPEMLAAERWTVADGVVKIQLKNIDPRAGTMVTYVRLWVYGPSSRQGASYCDGDGKPFSLLVNLKAGSSTTAEVPLFYPASAGMPCTVEFDFMRSKEASWAEGVKAATTFTVRPMPTDFLLPYTRRP